MMIRRRRVVAHQRLMLAAVATSALFLTSYLVYHYHTGSTPFPRERHPGVAPLYFAILGTHTVLAAAVVPLVAITLWHAARNRIAKHRRIARWTLPVWLYVSVTGVVIYLMLYQWYAV